ncbi:MAG: 5'/3'-nucleotidase SurE [Fidelibacterota bacterium]
MPEPLILVTNDDGISSEGIAALREAVSDLGQVVVVAPETEKSAVGHAITISDPIRIRELPEEDGINGFAIGGTPADCVKLAVRALLLRKPDLILSGINHGANVGMSILYSGTVSAATEGVILGVPSIAISLDSWISHEFEYAGEIAEQFARMVLKNGLPPGVALNINVPALSESEIVGIKLTRQGRSYYEETFDKRVDPRKRTYYWMDGFLVQPDEDLEVDDIALDRKFVSVTPLHYNLTHEDSLIKLATWKVFDRSGS